jgi:protein TonB
MGASMIAGIRLGCLAAGFASFIAFAALAQSSAVIVPGAVAEGTTPAAPVMPLDIQDTDYPIQSLLTNEEGKIQLNLIVNARGQVTAARVLTPTKLARLEQQAAAIARARWQFKPAMREGEPVAAQVNVDVEWKLPLRPADDIYSKMMGFSVAGKGVVEPKELPLKSPTTLADYPIVSGNLGQQGEVAMQARILPDGSIGAVKVIDSSGFPRLDERAITIVKEKFAFEPGTIDGMPAEMSTQILFSFILADIISSTTPVRGTDRINRNTPERFCHSMPIIGASTGMTSKGEEADVGITQWVHVVRSGAVDDVIVRTDKGWMRYSPPLIRMVSDAAKNQDNLVNQAAPKIASLMSAPRRPASCWYRSERSF